MARKGAGGGFNRGGGSGRPRNGGGGKPKGQIRDGKAVQYSVKDSAGNTTYLGSTNNPRQRAGELKADGKMGPNDKLVVQSKPVSRQNAERLEAGRLSQHRRENGQNPVHNKTNDGRFYK